MPKNLEIDINIPTYMIASHTLYNIIIFLCYCYNRVRYVDFIEPLLIRVVHMDPPAISGSHSRFHKYLGTSTMGKYPRGSYWEN